MSPVCPAGHVSTTADYCDQCGVPIAGAAAPSPGGAAVNSAGWAPTPGGARAPTPGGAGTPTPGPHSTQVHPPLHEEDASTSPSPAPEPCPACGARRSGDDRYCEGCGHDFLSGPVAWEAVIAADRELFDRVAPAGLAFPASAAERRVPLAESMARIGRGRRGEPVPEIDVPDDPGVSHLHAVLERRPDGGYALRDLGSTNGTTVNGAAAPTADEPAVPVRAGDRILLGAWTAITLRTTD
jgi:hypothetical protein